MKSIEFQIDRDHQQFFVQSCMNLLAHYSVIEPILNHSIRWSVSRQFLPIHLVCYTISYSEPENYVQEK